MVVRAWRAWLPNGDVIPFTEPARELLNRGGTPLLPRGRRSGQSQGVRGALHGSDDERDVLVEVHAELGGPVDDILAAHAARERLVLHLLPHRFRLDFVYALRG